MEPRILTTMQQIKSSPTFTYAYDTAIDMMSDIGMFFMFGTVLVAIIIGQKICQFFSDDK